MKIAELAEALAIAQRNTYEGAEEEGFDVNNGSYYLGTLSPEQMPREDVNRMRELHWVWDGHFACWTRGL